MQASLIKSIQKIRIWLVSPRLPLFLAGLAFILMLPGLWATYKSTDLIQLEKFKSEFTRSAPMSISGQYSFSGTDPFPGWEEDLPAWWGFGELRQNFWRPLSELTHWIDSRLWLHSSLIMHLQSLLWFSALIFVTVLFYRRMMGVTWVAGLASLLFAIDDAHGMAVAWWGNRYVIISMLFALFALINHDRFRKDGWKPGAILGPVFFLLAMLAGESGLAIGGYILSYAIFLDHRKFPHKYISVLPYCLIAFIWWVFYRTMGYGVYGSGLYIDPGREPLVFITAFFKRFPVLFLGQWGMPPAQTYMFLPGYKATVMLVCASVFTAIVLMILVPLVRRSSLARFWMLGMVLSILIICTGSPENRNLYFVGLGAMGLLAMFFNAWGDHPDWLPRPFFFKQLAKGAAFFFIIVHVMLAIVLLPLSTVIMNQNVERYVKRPAKSKLLDYDDDYNVGQIVLLNFPKGDEYVYFQMLRRKLSQLTTPPFRMLSSGNVPIAVKRVGKMAIEVSPRGGFMPQLYDRFFRGPAHPFTVGERLRLENITVEVLSLTNDNRPEKVRFTFTDSQKSLEDPFFRFIRWRKDEYVEYSLPAIGETKTIQEESLDTIFEKIIYYF